MSGRNKTIALLTFLVIVWGINWPLSKIALSYAPPECRMTQEGRMI